MLFLKKLLTWDKYVILSLLLLTLLFCRESFVVLQNVMIIVIICTKIIIQHHLVKTNGKFWWHRHTFKLENYVEIFWNMPGKIKQLFSWSELTEKESLKSIYILLHHEIFLWPRNISTDYLTTWECQFIDGSLLCGNFSFVLWLLSADASLFFFLSHFGHLSHLCIETHCNSVF